MYYGRISRDPAPMRSGLGPSFPMNAHDAYIKRDDDVPPLSRKLEDLKRRWELCKISAAFSGIRCYTASGEMDQLETGRYTPWDEKR